MKSSPINNLPLADVLRADIALALQQLYGLQTVGGFLGAWRNPGNRKYIEDVFDSPAQARNAVATFATWLGMAIPPTAATVHAWWRGGADRSKWSASGERWSGRLAS